MLWIALRTEALPERFASQFGKRTKLGTGSWILKELEDVRIVVGPPATYNLYEIRKTVLVPSSATQQTPKQVRREVGEMK
jgi:hypothetical protein